MNYKIYKSNVICNNQEEIIKVIDKSYSIHQEIFSGEDFTWSYRKYNTFGLTSSNELFYDLFCELKTFIYDYLDHDRLWLQSWINYHSSDKVLGWHNHEYPFHGYICVRPHETTTVFSDYKVKNEIGNVYIGPGDIEHKVVVDNPYEDPRITIGFDILTKPDNDISYNIGCIPFPK